VTGRALLGCTAKDFDAAAVNLPPLGMTKLARHLLVRALQRESSVGVMIELVSLPPRCGVTWCAIYRVLPMPELSSVDVLVATLATFGRRLEPDFPHAALRTAGPVTIRAAQNRVGAFQRIARRGVIERFQFLPGSHGVAGFAEVFPRFETCFHGGRKFPGVRIAMATLAGPARKMVLPVGAWRTAFLFMTILAGYCRVCAFQRECRGLVLGDRVQRRTEPLHVMAVLASIRARLGCELPAMRVLVAIQAFLRGRMIVGLGAHRHMTFGAGNSFMLAGEGILRRPVADL